MLAAVAAVILLAPVPKDAPGSDRAAGHLELRLSDFRGFRDGSFFLHMVPAGEVTRESDAPLGPKYIGPDARRDLRALLAREKFFELKEEYGAALIEGRARRVTVWLDGRYHSVALNDLEKTDKPAGEIRRALRVWYGILKALSDPGTIQMESLDRFFLEPQR